MENRRVARIRGRVRVRDRRGGPSPGERSVRYLGPSDPLRGASDPRSRAGDGAVIANIATRSVEDLSREDLLRVLERDRFVKEQLSIRLASTIAENVELLGLVNELQRDLASRLPTTNGDGGPQCT